VGWREDNAGFRRKVAVPLKGPDDRVIGVLSMDFDGKNTPGPEETAWINFAQITAVVLDRLPIGSMDSLRKSSDLERKRLELPSPLPDVLLQAAVVTGSQRTTEGQLIEGVAVAWFEIIAQLGKDPDFLFKIPWRKLEEIVAGAYERAGWPEVILTPRSGDHGRDIIATRPGIGSIRIVDQIKAYKPGHVVTADEVRSMLGVLIATPNVSKGLITTTSHFAPGIEKDSTLRIFMPYRLELKDGKELRQWLLKLARRDRLPEGG
jgi:restriction system protein